MHFIVNLKTQKARKKSHLPFFDGIHYPILSFFCCPLFFLPCSLPAILFSNFLYFLLSTATPLNTSRLLKPIQVSESKLLDM